ncbi:kinesin-like protein Tea2 [Reticulomyxa filosa]|uniref:Kinesin-like protein Tea2 n=1 Tax=Reticulomyxa filosa TaxID=46433 RepID=X6MZB1_RETFI|nr:kinesin-like protein Tea2 [Reticulomyxa filosa]|eukprot:ETO18978.1 kinesin-like protein Tea2 [Reticulomyxa filosa]
MYPFEHRSNNATDIPRGICEKVGSRGKESMEPTVAVSPSTSLRPPFSPCLSPSSDNASTAPLPNTQTPPQRNVEIYLRIGRADGTEQAADCMISDDQRSVEIDNCAGVPCFFNLFYFYQMTATITFFLNANRHHSQKKKKKKKDKIHKIAIHQIEQMRRGYNGVVFAYGVSGSCKTHTVITEKGDFGLIQRLMEQLFDMDYVQNESFFVQMSCAEIYCENLSDLLATGNHELKPHARHRTTTMLTKVRVSNVHELENVMSHAIVERKKRQMLLNFVKIVFIFIFLKKEETHI